MVIQNFLEIAPKKSVPRPRLVVFLHGLGMNPSTSESLFGRYWSRFIPEAHFVFPEGPLAAVGYDNGRDWIGIGQPDWEESLRFERLQQAARVLEAFIHREQARIGVSQSETALAGFSLGGSLALHWGLRLKEPLAGILTMGSAMCEPQRLTATSVPAPPIALIHGDKDTVVLPREMVKAEAALQALGARVQTHLMVDMGHEVTKASLAIGAKFIRQSFSTVFSGSTS